MDAGTRILIVGGMAVLFFGLVLGVPMARARGTAARAPRYLFAAHLAAIIQGAVLLSLTIVVDFSPLSSGVEATAAWLLVGGVVLFGLGLTLNWIQGVEDGFAEKSPGNKVSFAGTLPVLAGAAILLYGVIAGL